jgi:hypothetical protein
MQPFWDILDFLRTARRRMRFGKWSRAPLRLLRLEVRSDFVGCDWVVRPADLWDESLRRSERDRNMTQQALADAVKLRDLLFSELPGVESAVLRAFRQSAREPPELIIAGTVTRSGEAPPGIRSIAMRAKLCGLRFESQDGILKGLQQDDFAGGSFSEPVLSGD